MDKLFVYGTLKRGGRLHGCLKHQQFLGEAITPPKYDLIGGYGFPFLVKGEYRVKGELYEVSEEMWPLLDDVEGVPQLYLRELVEVLPLGIYNIPPDDGNVWGYVSNMEHKRLSSEGLFVDHDNMTKEWINVG